MVKARIDLDEALTKTRKRLSKRLMKALQERRLHEELKLMERKGRSFYDDRANGQSNGHKSRCK